MLKKFLRRHVERQERHREQGAKQWVTELLEAVPKDAIILEIGAGYNPRFMKGGEYRHLFHLDHADRATLRAKYAADVHVAHLVGQIQEVDFVFQGEPIETLIPPELRFDVIFGSHCLEHQVDLVGHLQSLEKLLKPGGRVIEIIPDLRRCFDMLRFPSVTSDVLLAHHRRAPIHQGKQIFDAVALEVGCNPGRLPTNMELEETRFSWPLQEAYQALQDAEQAACAYRDCHAWAFIPESLQLMLIELRLLELTTLQATAMSVSYENQFCVVLQAAPEALSAPVISALEQTRLVLAKQLRLRG